MMTDIEIAQQCRMHPIADIAATAGIDEILSRTVRPAIRPRSTRSCSRIAPNVRTASSSS